MSDLHRVIAIDFDGTLVQDKFPEIGEPINFVIDRAKEEMGKGSHLVLLTMREGKLLDAALRVCESFGLVFEAVNDSTEEWKSFYRNNPRKIGATEYWDDRAINPVKEFQPTFSKGETE
jgi:phosphoserine phosphatase